MKKTWIITTLAVILAISEGCFAQSLLTAKSTTNNSAIQKYITSEITGKIVIDTTNKTIILSDENNKLQLRLNYNGKCMLDDVRVRGSENIVSPATGVCSAISTGGQWFTTRGGIATPTVEVIGNVVTVSNINYGGAGVNVIEQWIFTTHAEYISWTIGRKYLSNATFDDSYFPGWDFASMNTWTGALLNNGGVAWCKFLETNGASLGQHAETISLWNKETNVLS